MISSRTKNVGEKSRNFFSATSEIGPEINAIRNFRYNHNRKIGNKVFEIETKDKPAYLGNDLTNQTFIHSEITIRLKSGNACYRSVQNLLCSILLFKNLQIKIYRNEVWPVVLYGCETWSITLRDERRLRVFENRVLMGIFGAKRDEMTGEWRKLHNEELNDLYCSPNIS
jgi:hypothetical protein